MDTFMSRPSKSTQRPISQESDFILTHNFNASPQCGGQHALRRKPRAMPSAHERHTPAVPSARLPHTLSHSPCPATPLMVHGGGSKAQNTCWGPRWVSQLSTDRQQHTVAACCCCAWDCAGRVLPQDSTINQGSHASQPPGSVAGGLAQVVPLHVRLQAEVPSWGQQPYGQQPPVMVTGRPPSPRAADAQHKGLHQSVTRPACLPAAAAWPAWTPPTPSAAH